MSYCSGPPRHIPPEYIGVPPETLQAWLVDLQSVLQQLAANRNANAASYAQGDGTQSVTYGQGDRDFVRKRIADIAYVLGLTPRRSAMRPGF